jgi:hypothetical protein
MIHVIVITNNTCWIGKTLYCKVCNTVGANRVGAG